MVDQTKYELIVVDDEKAIEILFKHTFKEEINSNKIDLLFYPDPHIALEKIDMKNNRKKILLTDLNMPSMTGFEFIQKAIDRGYKGKLLIVSAYDDSEKQERAKELGVDQFLTKPFDLQSLKSIVNQYLE